MDQIKINLSGKIPKGDELSTYQDWRNVVRDLARGAYPHFIFTSPDQEVDESQPWLNFGYNAWLLSNADVVLINASTKLGAGTAQEMIMAKYFSKPVVCVLPRNSHHRRENVEMRCGVIADWVHPFVFSTSDVIVDDFDGALKWIEAWRKNPGAYSIKTIDIIDRAAHDFATSDEFARLNQISTLVA